MAGGSQESAFGLIGAISSFAGFDEFQPVLPALGGVAQRRGNQLSPLAAANRTQADLNRHLGAVLAQCEEVQARAHGPDARSFAVASAMYYVPRAQALR